MRTLLGVSLLGIAGAGIASIVVVNAAIEAAHAIEDANAILARASDELDGRDK